MQTNPSANQNGSLSRKSFRSAFSLIEMLVVIAVIGIIAAIAIPSVANINDSAKAASLAGNYKNFATAFRAYEKLEGDWPPDNVAGVMPPGVGLEEYLSEAVFESTTTVGGRYNWEGPENHSYAGVSIQGATGSTDVLAKVDEILDDGNLFSGYFRRTPNGRYTYIIEWNNP